MFKDFSIIRARSRVERFAHTDSSEATTDKALRGFNLFPFWVADFETEYDRLISKSFLHERGYESRHS
jgi:hypothetical protein